MGAKRIVWHVGLGRLLRRRGPQCFEIREEVPLSDEPARVDYLILRKLLASSAADDAAETLRRLWPLLPLITVLEYKSPGRSYRTGNLDRLWSYVHAYHADDAQRHARRTDLAAVLIVPARTPSLNADVAAMGLSWEDRSDGYWRVTGGLFALHVVEIDVVGPAEGDDVLHSLGNGRLRTQEARWFWTELVGSQEAGMSVQDLEGYDELTEKFLQALPPEQVLSHYPPEQRLAGLDHDHQALALPLDVLRALPESYFVTLSAEVQTEIRRRIRGS